MQLKLDFISKSSFFVFMLICLFSCSKAKNECSNDEKYLIVKSIIDKDISYPTIPPPPPEGTDIKELLNDSIKLEEWVESNSDKKLDKYKIAIQPSFWNPTQRILLDSIYKVDYQILVDQLITENDETPLRIENITPSENFALKYAPTNDSLKANPRLWEDFDFILSFSRISFNEECNKAALIFSVSYGKLNGYSVLVLMKKEEGVWLEREGITLTVS